MSLQSVEKPGTRVASRRNVVRGAAWTGAAVTIVVATPNIAAASGESGSATGSLRRLDKRLTFNVRLSNAGAKAIATPYVVLSCTSNTIVAVSSLGENWSYTGGKFTYSGSIPVNGWIPFTPVVDVNSNDKTQVWTLSLYSATNVLLDTLVFSITNHDQPVVTGV